MSFGNSFENELLALIFNATAMANLAQNNATSPETALGVALHTGDPGEAGDQTTNEATYTGYAREDVTRNGSNWSVSANSVSPVADIEFTVASGGTNTITHFSVGKASGDYLIISGTVTPNISVSDTVQPILTTSTAITVD